MINYNWTVSSSFFKRLKYASFEFNKILKKFSTWKEESWQHKIVVTAFNLNVVPFM